MIEMIEILVVTLPIVIIALFTLAWLDSRRKRTLSNMHWFNRRIAIEISRASEDTPGSACDLTLGQSGEYRNPVSE